MPERGGMLGRRYLEHGQPVTAMTQVPFTRWHPVGDLPVVWFPPRGHKIKGCPFAGLATYKGAPRNVTIKRADASEAVRPFRGLRRIRIANQPED